MQPMIRLGVNLDHVATVRNARGGSHPDIVAAAQRAAAAGADGITAHLREDRRHIRDDDLFALKQATALPLNMEMAATPEMLKIALKLKPHACCLVPEKRAELTTEGGLNVAAQVNSLRSFVAQLKTAGAAAVATGAGAGAVAGGRTGAGGPPLRISLFIDPEEAQLAAAASVGADIVELHTGAFCESLDAVQFQRLADAAEQAAKLGLELHAGHGLNYDSLKEVARLPQLKEVNIGHFIIGEALTEGLDSVIKKVKELL